MTTIEQLNEVFNNNFVMYYRVHLCHVNIEGRNFYSDHKLLKKMYKELFHDVDKLAELLRAFGEYMPCEIQDVLNRSAISTAILEGDSEHLLTELRDDLHILKDSYNELIRISQMEGYEDVADFAEDRVLRLDKFIWQLTATLS
jgi:DNA-binding ferritin-like protein